MTNLLPWIAIAGLGALHGLSPANGWMFAAAWGLRSRDPSQARHALLPIGIGHFLSVAIVALAFAQGLSMDRTLVQGVAGAVLMGAAALRLFSGDRLVVKLKMRAASGLGMGMWSFVMASAHGAGLMLVPALVPLCLSDSPAREITASGSLMLALGAVALHAAAMLAVTGVIATGVCRGIGMHPRLLRGQALNNTWTAALALTGAGLWMLR